MKLLHLSLQLMQQIQASITALYYKQEVFRKRDNGKFHDQRGYLIYDKKIKWYITLSAFQERYA